MGKSMSRKKDVGTIISIEWPILRASHTSIRETVAGIIDLLESQLKITVIVHQIIVGNKELSGLSFSYRGRDIFLNFIDGEDEGVMRLLVVIPSSPI